MVPDARRVLAVATVVIAVSGCGRSVADIDVGIAVQDAALVATGAELHAVACASCHGEDLPGARRSLMAYLR